MIILDGTKEENEAAEKRIKELRKKGHNFSNGIYHF